MERYYSAAEALLTRIRETQRDAVGRAGIVVAASLRQGGAILLMDERNWVSKEVCRRPGALTGIVPFDYQMRVHAPLDWRPAVRSEAEQETMRVREVSLAIDSVPFRKGDVLITVAYSGSGGHLLEAARQCSERGLIVIAIAPFASMAAHKAKYPECGPLREVADMCVDTCTDPEVGMVALQDGAAMAAGTGLAALHLLWAIQAQAACVLEAGNKRPHVHAG